MNIRKLYNLRKYQGDVGIEIEVEGENLPWEGLGNWSRVNDGSLKGMDNGEFVTKKGVFKEDIEANLTRLKKAFDKSIIDDSVRAGVHIHVNVQDMTHLEIMTFITTYYIVEQLLINYCGETRKGNLFCLRFQDSEGILDFIEPITYKKSFRCLHTDNIRYAAMNLKPLTSYGSIEFRSLQTPQDFMEVKQWADMLLSVLAASKEFESPVDCMSEFSMNTEPDFIKRIFKEHAPTFLKMKDFDLHLKIGMRNAQDIAFMADWVQWEKDVIDAHKMVRDAYAPLRKNQKFEDVIMKHAQPNPIRRGGLADVAINLDPQPAPLAMNIIDDGFDDDGFEADDEFEPEVD